MDDLVRRAGLSSSDLPEFLRDTMRVSVLGFLNYFKFRSKQ